MFSRGWSRRRNPFYLDSGASIQISAKAIKGVGGYSIMEIGIGNIKLRSARGAYIALLNVLFVPNLTVHLIYISSLTRDSTCNVHFSDISCWIDNAATKLIARGLLAPSKGLYTLDLHSPHAEHRNLASPSWSESRQLSDD